MYAVQERADLDPGMTTSTDAGGSLWLTRITWALLGAGVTAALMGDLGGSSEPPMSPSSVAAAERKLVGSGSTGGVGSLAGSSTGGRVTGTSGLASSTGAVVASTGTGRFGVEPSTSEAAESTESTGGTDEQALPRIPLPRMPGTRFMRRARQVDEETGEPVIILGLTVPAPGSQVEGFYRRALKDAGLTVFGSPSPPSTMHGGHRSTIRSRGTHVSAEVTVQQRAGRLRTAVRIYWRLKG